MRDAHGNLYGTTFAGGASNQGTVFKLDTTGNETVLYSFTGTGGDDAGPEAGLAQDTQGNLYGTTTYGGDLACGAPSGCGTAFELDTTGKETVLHSFTSSPDGANPFAGLVRDAQGNLYGTTSDGGASGGGTVFKVDASGNETVLYSFCSFYDTGCTDGSDPWAGLARDVQGNLYGTTTYSGDLSCDAPYGCGTVFKLDTTGKETVLYSFTGAVKLDGMGPEAAFIAGRARQPV